MPLLEVYAAQMKNPIGAGRFGTLSAGRESFRNASHEAEKVINKHPYPLQRLIPNRMLFKGAALKSLLWSAVGSIGLCLLLVQLWLIAGLLIDQGGLELTDEELPLVKSLTAEVKLPVTDSPNQFSNSGILPSVWRARTCPCGVMLATAYERIPPLQSNNRALAFLTLCTAVTGGFISLVYSRGRTHALRAAVEMTKQERRAMHRQTLRLGPSEIQESRNGELQTLFSADMDDLQAGLSQWILRLGREPLKMLLLAGLAIAAAPLEAVAVLLLSAGCWLLIAWQHRQGDSQAVLGKSRAEEKLRLLAESLRTTRLVRGYGKEMEAFEEEQFQQQLTRLSDETTSWLRQDWVQRWGLSTIAAFVGSVILLFVGHQVLKADSGLTLPSAVLMLSAVGCMHVSLRNLWNLRRDVTAAAHVATRIEKYLSQAPSIGQAVGAKFLQPLSKSLVFDNVSCESPDRRALLAGCSFQIKAGSQIAIVSTDPWEARAIAYLLPRFIEPGSGQIFIDGEDIAWVTLESLRAEAIMVSARDPFFTGTVLENIRCGSGQYSLQEVTEAAKLTHAHNFILKLPQGYETVIGEHGEQLDQGQSFRMGLARAVLRNPALLILEEPNEPMDEGTKSLLDDAYNRIVRGRTVIFLPHRMSTLRRADEIILLHKGTVEAMGNHAALVKASPLYRHWEYLNFNVFRHELEPQNV